MTFWELYKDVCILMWFWASYLLLCAIIGYFVLGCVVWLGSKIYHFWMGRGGDDN